MLPWQFFSTAVAESGNSLVSNSNLVSKVYFPRLIVPAGSTITSFVDFIISAVFMAVLMIWYRYPLGLHALFVPAFTLLALALALGAGAWVSALMVKYRDFRFIVPFIVQFGLYVSPVGFVSDAVPDKYRLLFALNPMVGVIDGFRWALLGGSNPFPLDPATTVISVAVTLIVLFGGIYYFRLTERKFADII